MTGHRLRGVAWVLAVAVLVGGCGVFSGKPWDVRGKSLGYEVAWSSGTDEDGWIHERLHFQPGVWIVEGDQQLGEVWVDPLDNYEGWGGKDLGLGEPPRVPDDVTALFVSPGWTDDHCLFRMVGVYDDQGSWTVAVTMVDAGLPPQPAGSAELDVVSAVLLVRSPQPDSVQIRVEDATCGQFENKVLWGVSL
ncbi:MAG: hypothetical protein LBH68_00955 [Bifidobacteriaceae bacterium]|jgi:hypothetical protein|nr:hypothetical protein [Bifidobacteriaceae bacterium]